MVYFDPLDIPEKIFTSAKNQYLDLMKKYGWLHSTFIQLNADYLLSDSCESIICPDSNQFTDVESYLNHIETTILKSINDFNNLFKTHLDYEYDTDLSEFRYFFHYLLGIGSEDEFVTDTASKIRQFFS